MSGDRSCQNIVNQATLQRLCGGLTVGSTYTGGYCRARQRLPLEMVSLLTQYLGERINGQLPGEWYWQGRRVRLIDGTTVTLPDTAANQEAFPQQRGQQPGSGFPICRVVGITCLASGALLNAAIGRFQGKGSDEQTMNQQLEGESLVVDDQYLHAFFSSDSNEASSSLT